MNLLVFWREEVLIRCLASLLIVHDASLTARTTVQRLTETPPTIGLSLRFFYVLCNPRTVGGYSFHA